MKKFLQKKLKDQKGMTLIELLAVIVIIAIIAAIAIPAIGNIIENSRYGAAKADFQNAIAAANLYVAEEGAVPTEAQLTADYFADKGSIKTLTFAKVGTTNVLTVAGKFEISGVEKTLAAKTNAELSELSAADFKALVNP
ncbi:prepilin-type N-terminal cleavage/methylation domain-containing protein [Planococcus sp. ISL-109]|uniref:prepilin-type N-terminal cleavage/methylation domain-containing protein n=1 Tax=Planococcus sp. ISL-109 TaxID=2819166 RepID=UPI001BE7E171|nr:prepilin-type N-terminal cleavage/methylation domain-containing protein [Planococcus sp. ISL-109]MBT2582425.1 prepilin-type N-terminal cleavage/methylation domain-containing protein [Planococcus sp. ISL-109]